MKMTGIEIQPRADAEVTRIEAPRGLVPLNLHELWQYRELIYFMLWRDVKGRYRQMAFGPLWMVISPLLNTLLFVVMFGVVAKLPTDGLPAPLFMYSALLVWTFFTGGLFSAANSLVGYRDLISKIYFPRLIVPLVGIGSAFVDFLISFLLLIGMMAYYHCVPSLHIVWLIPYLLLAVCTGLGVGLWFASWIVHFRDISNILGYIVRFWMYACPVVYSSAMVAKHMPEQWMFLYYLNPMTVVIEGVRWSMLGVGRGPDIYLLVAFFLVIPLMITGAYYFRRTERSIVDIA